MDNFYSPLNVRITGLTVTVYETIFDLGKIGGREGRYKKAKGSPAKLPQHWLQEICKHV